MGVTRREARCLVFQAIYEADFNNMFNLEHAKKNLDRSFKVMEIEKGEDTEYSYFIIEKLFENIVQIDGKIQELATKRKFKDTAFIDKNIIRLGLCEMLYSQDHDVPLLVAIDEAIELAKLYGSNSSKLFVNGVLGKCLNELKKEA